MISDACEDIGEPCLGVDVVELGGLDERVDDGGALSAAIGTAEQPLVFSGNSALGSDGTADTDGV